MTEQKPHHLEQRAERFGRWDGRHPGYAEIKSGNLKKQACGASSAGFGYALIYF